MATPPTTTTTAATAATTGTMLTLTLEEATRDRQRRHSHHPCERVLLTHGHGFHGQLGLGSWVAEFLPTVVPNLTGLKVTQVSCGYIHTAALTENGQVFTWGSGFYGVLGHGDLSQHNSPTEVEALSGKKVIQVSCGWGHTAAVTEKGEVFTWGSGQGGRLGLSIEDDQWHPRHLSALNSVHITSVSCGGTHTAFLTEEGHVFECGYYWEADQMLAKEGFHYDLLPKEVAPLPPCSMIACGSDHMVMVTREGRLFAKGQGSFGQLGIGMEKKLVWEPVELESLSHVTIQSVACGHHHTAAITDTGDLYTWGWGDKGELGLGDNNVRKFPKRVDSLSGHVICKVTCGGSHTIAVSEANDVFVWGSGLWGQLGNGNPSEYNSPRLLSCLRNHPIVDVACGFQHSALLLEAPPDATIVEVPPDYQENGDGAALDPGSYTTPRGTPRSPTPVESKASSEDDKEDKVGHAILIDLDNMGYVLSNMSNSVEDVPQTVVIYIFGGPVFPKVSLSFIPIFSELYAGGRLQIIRTPRSVKNAADFALAFFCGALHKEIPLSVPFTIVSNDAGLSHVVDQLVAGGRRARRLDSSEVTTLVDVFNYGPGRWGGRPSTTAAPSEMFPIDLEGKGEADESDHDDTTGATTALPLKYYHDLYEDAASLGSGHERMLRKADKVVSWLQSLPKKHRPRTSKALLKSIETICHMKKVKDQRCLLNNLSEEGVLTILQDQRVQYTM